MKKFLLTTLLLALVSAACAPLATVDRASRPPQAPPAPPTGPTPTTSTSLAPPTTTTTTTTTTPTPPAVTGSVPAPAASGKQWVETFGEEFNGTDYDHSKLTPCFDWNTGSCTGSFNQGREWYSASQVQVSNGTAKLVAQPGSSPDSDGAACFTGTCTYRSGLLATSRQNINSPNYLYQFTYGYVEARMKLPTTQGFFTAFWMLPADPSFNYRSEIDIAEVLGYDPNTMYMNYHYDNRTQDYTPNNGTGNNGACATDDKTGKFVRFGVDWEPTSIAWYIDGVKCGQFSGNSSTIENGPMQIVLNLMVDHSWERDFGHPLLDPSLTRQLEVDYLRVYQQR